MRKVRCEAAFKEVPDENGDFVEGIVAQCTLCYNITYVVGQTQQDWNRCFNQLRETCKINIYKDYKYYA